MSTSTPEATADAGKVVDPGDDEQAVVQPAVPRRHRRPRAGFGAVRRVLSRGRRLVVFRWRRIPVVLVAVVLGVVSATLWIAEPGGDDGDAGGSAADGSDSPSLATVTEQTLSSQTQLDGALGYAGTYDVVSHAGGTITALPTAGQVVSRGQSLYQVDGSAVVLLYGEVPAYRSLSTGMSGADVRQLNANLVALGYATSSELDPASDTFGPVTAGALAELQADLGAEPTGSLPLGQAVFLPTEARVTAIQATLGAPAPPGATVMQPTSTSRVVTVELDPARQSQVEVGDEVTIILPDNQTIPGTVSSISTVATAPASSPAGTGSGSPGNATPSGSQASGTTPSIEVQVTPDEPEATGSLDQAPVQVTITTNVVEDALVVPVVALLAIAGGRHAVEVVDAVGHHDLVPVELGLFDEANGLVQVTGPGLSAGQRVVVPDL